MPPVPHTDRGDTDTGYSSMGKENGSGLQGPIGFIGAGNMAEAMISGLIRTNTLSAGLIRAADPSPGRLAYIAETYGIETEADNLPVVQQCPIVVLAVKPQQMASVVSDLAARNGFGEPFRRLVMSVAAGLTIAAFEKWIYEGLPEHQRHRIAIVRVMPNTPALVGEGISAYSANASATPEDLSITRRILAAMGESVHCEESRMNAVTAVSGSGPAYCFYFLEAIAAAGEKLGLTGEEAETLAIATFRGSLRLLDVQKEKPAVLRKKVTSPGGTTEAAIRVFDDAGVRRAIMEAVGAAARRASELSAAE